MSYSLWVIFSRSIVGIKTFHVEEDIEEYLLRRDHITSVQIYKGGIQCRASVVRTVEVLDQIVKEPESTVLSILRSRWSEGTGTSSSIQTTSRLDWIGAIFSMPYYEKALAIWPGLCQQSDPRDARVFLSGQVIICSLAACERFFRSN